MTSSRVEGVVLRTFGTLRLESPDGPVAGPAAQRHRLALLALLAAAPGRQLSRDQLLLLLWPDSDAAHGRTLLNTTVHALRKQLGSDVIRSVGDGLYLDPDGLPSDLDLLELHTREGRPEEAVAQYTGPFLQGFHLPGSSEFEDWLAAERQRYHTWVHDLLDQLASSVDSTAPRARASWTERLAQHEPHSSRAALNHMRSLVEAGDRAAAIEFAGVFQARLQADLQAAPDPDIQAFTDALRQPHQVSSRWSEPIREVPPSHPMAPNPAGTRRLGLWSVGLLGTLALLVVAVTNWRGSTVAPELRAQMVLVMPFRVQAGSDLGFLGPGLMDLLAARINGMGSLATVDPAALVEFLGHDGGGSEGELAIARRAATAFDAGTIVLGTLVEMGNRLEIRAGIHDAGGARRGEVLVGGPPDQLPALVNQLASRLLAEQLRQSGRDIPSLAALTTDSLHALRAYLEGENALRSGQLLEAVQGFERAVAIDSTFALGWYRLGLARDKLPGLMRPWWEREVDQTASRLADRLPAFERELVRTAAMPNGEALPILRRLVARRPSSADAWYRLGMAIDNESAARGIDNRDAVEAFARALELDPGHHQATRAQAYAVARARDFRRLERLAHALARTSADDALLARTYLAFGRADSVAMQQVLTELVHAPESLIREAAAAVTTMTRRPDLSRPIYELLVAPHQPAEVRWLAHTRLADLAVAEGRWHEARRQIIAADLVLGTRHLGKRARLTILPFSPVTAEEADGYRTELLAAFEAGHSPEGPGRTIPGLAYNAGMISASRGDTLGIREALAALDQLVGTAHANRLPLLRASLRAEIAWIAGNPTLVIALLNSAIDPNSNQRFLMARSLESVGRVEEAMQWYRSYPDLALNAPNQMGWRAASLLRLAELHDQQGAAQPARAAREEFVQLWRDADPELQPLVEEVRARLAATSR